jgi:glucose-1-phosphate adenylyltransferase
MIRHERPKVLAFVLAGGEGSRLHDLTAQRCKPSVPFNGKHRIVDFVLSNLINSEVYSVYLLVQYKSQALIEHVRQSWTLARFIPDHFVTIVPPQMHNGPEWFQGTADAVGQNLHLIETFDPDFVAVFGADHVYRMDVRQMLQAHIDQNADVSIATLPVSIEQCRSFGIVETDEQLRVTEFKEKPATTASMPGKPGKALASMGNYIFSADVLKQELRRARERGESDFGKHILPRMVESHRLLAYDFTTNVIPGVGEFEEHAYWRDVGTIDAYFEAHLDTLGAKPRFRMTNPESVIYELHVKGFTEAHPDVPEELRGTYAGLATRRRSSTSLARRHRGRAAAGAPVRRRAACCSAGLRNYWGYNSIGFFAPHALRAAAARGEQVREFKRWSRRCTRPASR